ncbi:isochorismate synthase [Gordonia insulae]|uniref:isochorismate synthase n=1 Tax=Gordonia insulae TaxID=2420509 RepID=A0A3G8JJ41_9ACTN|nr:isochorismate synthase [Gordonia insulae]AZG45044.1 Putative isochorismate synthase MenF [Gordonia insulae]
MGDDELRHDPVFLLSRPDEHVIAAGAHRRFDHLGDARTHLRSGDGSAIVGALPFDLRRPCALTAPVEFHRRTGRWRGRQPTGAVAARVTEAHPEPAQHVRRVAHAVATLADPSNGMDKVVLARRLSLESSDPLSPWEFAARLSARDHAGNAFAADLSPAGPDFDGHHLIGSSPEVLVRKDGDVVTCHPLAGSTPRNADPAVDTANGHRLRRSAKDRREHGYVVDALASALAPLCRELDVPAEPTLTTTPTMWHLGTPIRGLITDPDITALDLAAAVHPTPAICGTPTPRARDHILAVEGDRGFYAGAVGWCDSTGDGEWMVSIRCADLGPDGRQLVTWAGGGIVADSVPADELAETSAKFRTVLSALDVAG